MDDLDVVKVAVTMVTDTMSAIALVQSSMLTPFLLILDSIDAVLSSQFIITWSPITRRWHTLTRWSSYADITPEILKHWLSYIGEHSALH